jgi:hypothetical protein
MTPQIAASARQTMIVYALASRQVQETVNLFRTREEAEAAVREIVNDEPQLAADVFVAEIELEDRASTSRAARREAEVVRRICDVSARRRRGASPPLLTRCRPRCRPLHAERGD